MNKQRKIRAEYARSCSLDNGDNTLRGVSDNQGMAMMTFQMNVLQRKAERAQLELKEAKDNYERELRHEKELIIAQRRIIEEERLKNNQLKEELRMFEEKQFLGIMPTESKEIKDKSSQGSPDAPKHKKIKIDVVTSTDDLHARDNSSLEITKVKKEVVSGEELKLKIVPVYVDENNKVHQQGTTAYTTNTRDNMNLLIATKDPKAIRSVLEASSGTATQKALGSHLIKHQPRVPTEEEITRALNAWRAMLRTTRDYYPDNKLSPAQQEIDLKVLMGARHSFRESKHDNPIAQQQWKHQQFGPIHRQYCIPEDYMAPDAFFLCAVR